MPMDLRLASEEACAPFDIATPGSVYRFCHKKFGEHNSHLGGMGTST
jgi:hypothetical protein